MVGILILKITEMGCIQGVQASFGQRKIAYISRATQVSAKVDTP